MAYPGSAGQGLKSDQSLHWASTLGSHGFKVSSCGSEDSPPEDSPQTVQNDVQADLSHHCVLTTEGTVFLKLPLIFFFFFFFAGLSVLT